MEQDISMCLWNVKPCGNVAGGLHLAELAMQTRERPYLLSSACEGCDLKSAPDSVLSSQINIG